MDELQQTVKKMQTSVPPEREISSYEEEIADLR